MSQSNVHITSRIIDQQATFKIIQSYQKILEAIVRDKKPKESGTIDIIEHFKTSKTTLGDYVTLDIEHRDDILVVRENIINYILDDNRKRPLNILLSSPPGSGKSFFVDNLAKSIEEKDVSHVEMNMSSVRDINDFHGPLDQVRNLKVDDKFPILFLDEFDSDLSNISMLLPLLWDGKLNIGNTKLSLGKIVIILAGSTPEVKKALKYAKDIGTDITGKNLSNKKLIDVISRINGGEIIIPKFDAKSASRNRKVDKICIAISLILRRYEKLEYISWSMLKFISEINFKHGVRSITHLIDLLPTTLSNTSRLSNTDLEELPFSDPSVLDSDSLAYHLYDENGPKDICELWSNYQKYNVLVNVCEYNKEVSN